MNEDGIKESAKATQEIAKTTSKGLDVAEKFGKFIANHIGGTIEQGMGIFEDKLKHYRTVNQLNYISKYNDLASQLGINTTKSIPLKLAIPLLEAASLEDDEYLQQLWVNLLLNASNERSAFNLQRAHINILEQLTTNEARILEAIYLVDTSNEGKNAVLTENLPDKTEVASERDINNSDINPVNPSEDTQLALANLARLRLIALPMTFGGGEIYHYVNHTLLGQRFYEACTVDL